MAERNYWVRTEHGRVWGPYPLAALERLRGQLTERAEASLDGKEWRPGADFQELRHLLQPARKIERAVAPPAAPRISRAIADAFGLEVPGAGPVPAPTARAAGSGSTAPAPPAKPQQSAPAAPAKPQQTTPAAPAKPQQTGPAPAAKPPQRTPAAPASPKQPPPAPSDPVEHVPSSGDLSSFSPLRLYAQIAATASSGRLLLQLEKGHSLRIVFRRGVPEHLSSDDPDFSLTRFLRAKNVLTAEKAAEAEQQAANSGQDVLAVLFQLQLIPPGDAHKLMADQAAFLIDRALAAPRGTFAFEKDAPPPPGAFPLGQKWSLLVDGVRRIDSPLLRARLGKRLAHPVVRSGGLALGKIEELGLNAQESRLYAGIDGTRTGEALLKAHDPVSVLRVLYLLVELGHLAFADAEQEAGPPPSPPGPAAAKELPKIAREASPPPPQPAAPKGPAPTLQASSAAKPTTAPIRPPGAPPKTAPVAMRPPPTFANAPAGETKAQAIKRLSALLEKLTSADHFEALGLERKGSTAAEVKRNFVVLARELHPDTVADPADEDLRGLKERLFARINEAAQVLGDDKRRKEYEAELDGKAASLDVARIFAAEESFRRAEILIKARKYKEALELLEKAIELNDKEAEFFAWRGYAQFLLSRDRKEAFEASARDCRKAIQMQERCVPAHLFLGHMSKVVGDLKTARKCYARVLELDQNHIEAQRELRLLAK